MDISGKLTIADLICFLRHQLISAREQKNKSGLERLEVVFAVIGDVAGRLQDKAVASLAEDLENAVRDSFLDVDWKSKIPSEEEIRLLLSPNM